ncbi:hypothetical protein [Brevundimonas aurantiaca]|uniref:hypothetical protein n=1 Tax=Brevundimonas aurantiaca TaxID=74316 RepID=UPI00174D7FA5|nr:hypothetical protein [Brevundimonas aurantiaca]
MMRGRPIAAAFVAACALSTTVAAQTPTTASPPNPAHAAYETAIRCFVANGHARGERRTAGDATGAARYDAQSRQAFDAAVKLGQTLHYSNERVNGDLGRLMDRELPQMVRDPAYFRQVVASCRAYGLM